MEDAGTKAFLGRGWSFPVRSDGAGGIAMVEYQADIREAIPIILRTNPGERLMRPEFGAGLDALVFEPMNTVTVELARHRVEQALVLFEPRIDRVHVDIRPAPRKARLDIEITYRVRRTNTFYNLVYPFYVREAPP